METINNEVIYQIYPLTFNYAKGSKTDPYKGAYGNLKGITAYADYIASLGVDMIWICPFYPYQGTGFGYDITDYKGIAPLFGNKEDLMELCTTFHSYGGIKVIIDQVYNHCADSHPWFQMSIKRIDPYTDFFIWADAKGYDDNGKPIPPNNWEAIWSRDDNSAWKWNEERQQFYMHSFDWSMPTLNLNNRQTQDAILDVARYWFKLGVDGFRLDAATHYAPDPLLRDNPLDDNGEQIHIYDYNTIGGYKFLNRLKDLCNSYPGGKKLLAEYHYTKDKHGLRRGKHVSKFCTCDAFFTNALKGGLKDIVTRITEDLAMYPYGEKLNWAVSNHDMERAATRIFGNDYTPQKLIMLTSLLLTMPGSVCIFQGEELGLPNPKSFNKCKNPKHDPLNIWTSFDSPWDASRAGFAMSSKRSDPTRKMALRPDAEQYSLAVDNQDYTGSVLSETKRLIAMRKNGIFDRYGDVEFIDVTPNVKDRVIAYVRTVKGSYEKMLCMYNFSDEEYLLSYKGVIHPLKPESYSHIKL